MRRHKLACRAIGPTFGRRTILAGATALVGLAAFRPALAGQRIALAAIVDADGKAGPLARELQGRPLTLTGYLAAPLTPADSWQLAEGPAMPCQLCGATHDIGAALTIEPVAPPDPSWTPLQAVTVRGTIDVRPDGAVRLIEARIERA